MNLPSLHTDSTILNHAFRTAIGDLVSNIQPFQDGLLDRKRACILAGLQYDTPWTRDAAINVWNGAGLIFPEAALNTLLAVLERRNGRIMIGGQYWDAIIWVTGAWANYLYNGDRDFLALALEAARNSLAYFEETEFNASTGLFRGPACYGDGVAAYPDRYAQTGGSSSILEWPKCNPADADPAGYGIPMQTLSTNCLYYQAYHLAGRMAEELKLPPDCGWAMKALNLKDAINARLWDSNLQRYLYLVDPWGSSDHQEGMGNCFAIMFGIASPQQAQAVIRSQYISPQGIPCVWPSFERYSRGDPMAFARHAGTVWPHIQGFWAEVAARAGAVDAFRFELFKLAELAVRDGQFAELYHPLTGEMYGGVQEGMEPVWHSCRRQTWSATAYIRMILMGLCGMDFSPAGITFQPLLPEGLSRLELNGMPYQKQRLHIQIEGSGTQVAEFTLNGQRLNQPFLPAYQPGEQRITIRMS
jgi:glycogen debranching enzyme